MNKKDVKIGPSWGGIAIIACASIIITIIGIRFGWRAPHKIDGRLAILFLFMLTPLFAKGYTLDEDYLVVSFLKIPIKRILWTDCVHIFFLPKRKKRCASILIIYKNMNSAHRRNEIRIDIPENQEVKYLDIFLQYFSPIEEMYESN